MLPSTISTEVSFVLVVVLMAAPTISLTNEQSTEVFFSFCLGMSISGINVALLIKNINIVVIFIISASN